MEICFSICINSILTIKYTLIERSDKSGNIWYQNEYYVFLYFIIVSGMLRCSLASRGREVCQVNKSLGLASLVPLFRAVHSMIDYCVQFSWVGVKFCKGITFTSQCTVCLCFELTWESTYKLINEVYFNSPPLGKFISQPSMA